MTKETTQHKNVWCALTAAQAQMGKLVKDSVNPHFKSKYADLADVMAAALPALNSNGLALYHQITENQMMKTVLMHGETETSIECEVPLIVAKNDMQGFKSATTYAKRIGAESVTGLAPDDDDGNAAANAAPDYPPVKSSAQLKRDGVWEAFEEALNGCQSMTEINALKVEYRKRAADEGWNRSFNDSMANAFETAVQAMEVFEKEQEAA